MICSTLRRGLGRSGMEGSWGSLIDAGSGVGCWSAGGSESSWWKRRARCRLSERSAPFLVLPSASLRARYSLVVGSCCARVTAMMCSAWLSCRSPPRLSRCWVRLPEEHGIGAVPVCSAKAASERNRSLPAVWPIRIAAVSAPQPCSASSRGRCAVTELGQLGREPLDIAVEAAQVRDLLARDSDPGAGGELSQLPVDPVKRPRLVERFALERGLELGAELEQMPAQSVHRAGALGDEIVAVFDQQPDLHRLLVQVRDREPLDTVLHDSSGDGERVDLIRLARLALTPARCAHPVRRHPHNPLARRQQRLLEPARTRPAVLDRPHALLVKLARPAHRGKVPRLLRLDLAAAADLAGSVIDRRQRMRSLVRVRSDHDHACRPFVWVTPNEADLRRTTVTRGEATLLSSHAGDPRTAAGDTSFAGQAWQSRRNRHESARRQPEDLPLRSDVTDRASTLTVTVVRDVRGSALSRTGSSVGRDARRPLERVRGPRLDRDIPECRK